MSLFIRTRGLFNYDTKDNSKKRETNAPLQDKCLLLRFE